MNRALALACLSVASSLLAAEPSTRPASAGTLLSFTFDDARVWPATPATPGAGTIDVAGGKDGSAGLSLALDAGATSASIASGPLAVANAEKDLARLTLAFSLSASSPRPVRVTVESFDADKRHAGSLHTTIYPAAADFYQRFALDLSTMTVDGAFDPLAPFVAITFAIDRADGWPAGAPSTIHVDNVHYARPAFYVSAAGDDARDGLTEATAFATPQHAIDVAQAGDVVVLTGGTYANPPGTKGTTPVVEFARAGTPAAWITLRGAPGATAIVDAAGRQAIHVQKGRAGEGLAYLEIRGLTVRGDADAGRTRYADEIGKQTPNVDAMGIVLWGRGAGVHHVRVAENAVEWCTSDGIHLDSVDWFAIERNVIRSNCWLTIGYAPAGLSVMKYANFDAVDDVPKLLIAGNRVSGNKLTVMNMPNGKDPKTSFFNGNGILIDANAENPPAVAAGRTLVQNNLVVNNGGGGIQLWGNHRLDLVNNTVVNNGTVLNWGEFGFERCADVRLLNNVVVASPRHALDTWMPANPDRATRDIVRTSNLYFGGIKPNVPGTDDHVGDPMFVHPTTQPVTADYRPTPGSPAIAAGRWDAITPAADLDGKPRPYGGAPTLGALEP